MMVKRGTCESYLDRVGNAPLDEAWFAKCLEIRRKTAGEPQVSMSLAIFRDFLIGERVSRGVFGGTMRARRVSREGLLHPLLYPEQNPPPPAT